MGGGKKVLLSGVQPTGTLTVGNYIGAVRQWAGMQDAYDCLFPLADLHAITLPQDPRALRDKSYEFCALYLACGLDPLRSVIFSQSSVPAHAHLAWILNCFTGMGELSRMTQFKEKGRRRERHVSAGLFDYPVLMAADVLLYDTNLVPVGADQKQHLELVRDLAARINARFGPVFTVPEPLIPEVGARVMSLQNPLAKMSKSDSDASSWIGLLDEPDAIRRKVRRAVTDPGAGVVHDPVGKPGIANLMLLYAVAESAPFERVEEEFAGKGYGEFKEAVAEALIRFLAPIRERYRDFGRDRGELDAMLRNGAERARERAERTIRRMHDALGFIPPGP